ncbi:hypothetical protein [Anaerotignum sp.]
MAQIKKWLLVILCSPLISTLLVTFFMIWIPLDHTSMLVYIILTDISIKIIGLIMVWLKKNKEIV